MKYYADVLIVGAGPTGLMASCQLSKFGISHIIIDKKSGPTVESRAIAVTARSLEIYDQLGIANEAVELGQFMKEFSVYIDGKPKAIVPIGEIGKGFTDFSFMLAFEQSKNEELLYKTIKSYGNEVLWETEFVSFEEQPDQINALVRDKEGNENFITARYLIGAEGAHSPVRHQLGLSFEGGTYENKFFVADVKMDWPFNHERLVVSPSAKNFIAFFPMPGDLSYRVLGTLPKQFANVEVTSFQEIEKVIKETSRFDIEFKQVNWFSVYRLHHRAVNKFRVGRCFLAGDAAHIHSPAGGQGMNTGLQDAYNLSWKLALVINSGANEKLLDTYHVERKPFADWLLNFTDRAFAMMTSTNPFIAFVRKHLVGNLMRLGLKINSFRTKIFKTVSQIAYAYETSSLSVNRSNQKLKFKAGERVPYFLNDGLSIHKKLNNKGFTCVCFYQNSKPSRINLPTDIDLWFKHLFIKIDTELNKLGIEKDLTMIIRPDSHIGLLGDLLTQEDIDQYMFGTVGFSNELKPNIKLNPTPLAEMQ